MATMKLFLKELPAGSTSDLVQQGYIRRTTTTEPRLSELVAEYRRIGYDVAVIEHRVEGDACGVCFGAGSEAGQVYGDIYVRPHQENRG